MKIDIIIVYVQRYERGHEVHFVPPITGIHLAAITPKQHSVRVVHQQVEEIDFDTDADAVALSFFSGFAAEAYRIGREFQARGKTVIAGGPHATFSADETLMFFNAVVIGEAESVWLDVLADLERGNLKRKYYGKAIPLENIPTPRYDLLPNKFFVPRVVQATRGCPFTCSFCTVPTLNPGFRTRPVADVLADIRYNDFRYWWQRKVVWFWDDNLTIKRDYISGLLSEMIPEKKWWLTQASMDIAKDPKLLDLMQKSGCIGVFFGIESFGAESLKDAHKQQNKVKHYKTKIAELHKRGICVMAGFISGFDGDSPESIKMMARQLYEIGVDVPFLSILTPYRGTAAYKKLVEEERIRLGKGWEHYNGYNVSFIPKQMSPEELLATHRHLWREAFSVKFSFLRIARAFFTLRWGAFLMCLFMNGFYCLKAFRNNSPRDFEKVDTYADIAELVRDTMHKEEESGPIDLSRDNGDNEQDIKEHSSYPSQ